ncbi:MAG: metal-sulfur cluster assembly factor [Actinobacteria bacterium]|nr:metal-sulfur cluster assembly factor [Actinomycetota bacterium]
MSTALDEASVRETLKSVHDPEIGINIVDLGLIYGVDIAPYTPEPGEPPGTADDRTVTVTMTLTTPGCPAGPYILQQVKNELEGTAGVKKAKIDLTFDPFWNESMMSEDVRWILGR